LVSKSISSNISEKPQKRIGFYMLAFAPFYRELSSRFFIEGAKIFGFSKLIARKTLFRKIVEQHCLFQKSCSNALSYQHRLR
jgi:hypothetical protein